MKSLFYAHIVRPAAKTAACIATVSEFARAEVLDWTGLPERRVVVVGNGVSSAFSQVGPKAGRVEPFLLYVGNRKPHKNIERLLTAFARSRAQSEVHLCLTGDREPSIESLAIKLKISDIVHYVGNPDDYDLAALYRASKGILLPSLYEGFGLPVLEAMACGTPALTARGHGAEEVASTCARLCEATDIDSIACGIDSMIYDDTNTRRMIAEGLQRAMDFSWETVASRLLNVLST